MGSPAASSSKPGNSRATAKLVSSQGKAANKAGQTGQQGRSNRWAARAVRWAIAWPARSAIQPVERAAIAKATFTATYDTGNTRISGRAVAPQQGPNPADTQREIDQGLNLLNQVRAVVAG